MWCCVVLRYINIGNQYLDKLYCPSPSWHKADIGIIPRIRLTIIVRENSEVIIVYPDYMYIIYTYISCNVIYIYTYIMMMLVGYIVCIYIYSSCSVHTHPATFPTFVAVPPAESAGLTSARIIYRSDYRIPFSYYIVSRKKVTKMFFLASYQYLDASDLFLDTICLFSTFAHTCIQLYLLFDDTRENWINISVLNESYRVQFLVLLNGVEGSLLPF
jgi:hypothetical protein